MTRELNWFQEFRSYLLAFEIILDKSLYYRLFVLTTVLNNYLELLEYL